MAVCHVIWVFISVVYGVLYRSVCVGLEVCAHLVVGGVCSS